MQKEDITRKLAEIKSKYPVDGSDFCLDVTRDYDKLIEEKNFLSHPVFKGIIEDVTRQLKALNALLLNDETLTDKQRDKIFAERRALKTIIKSFGVDAKDQAIEALIELVDSKL